MSNLVERCNYTVSQNYLSAIVNNDYSGVEDDEHLEELYQLVEDIGTGIIDIPEEEEPSFERCDVSGLFSDCITITIFDFVKTESPLKVVK